MINSVEVPPDRQTQLLEALHLGQSSATAVEIEQLRQLICENADVFALDNSELGHTNVVQHHAHTGDHRPIKQPVKRVLFAYRETIAKVVEEMEETGVSNLPLAREPVLLCWFQRKMALLDFALTIGNSMASPRKRFTQFPE